MTGSSRKLPEMLLRRSSFVHSLPVGENRFLLIHAVSQLRFTFDGAVVKLIDHFITPRTIPDSYPEIAKQFGHDVPTLTVFVNTLVERGLLTDKSEAEEQAEVAAKLGATYGRDPSEMLDRYRRELKEGGQSYWAAGAAQGVKDLGAAKKRLDIALFGDCDVHMESDFLRKEAAARGYDLRVAATVPDDFAFASEHKHDAIIIGALYARHFITADTEPDIEPHSAYIVQAKFMLEQLREKTAAPILIDNLPEPTVQPLGLAEHGLLGHRNRFRRANLALAELVESYADVHVVDVAATLGAEGSVPLIDDWQVGFTHMGSPGWLLQRQESERAAVHNIFPGLAGLAKIVDGDPYRREAVVARAHIDALVAALGIGRKKCAIVDLDGTLWPRVLAVSGGPFAWEPSISGVFSYIGLYFGLHEALLCLKKRGIVLACVSKNDEAVVRELWKYADHYPRERLLKLDDFVTTRVNWNDKVENIISIAEELGFAPDAFLFIDDHPVERDRVRQRLPEVEVWGDDPFSLRRMLLNDPRLQVPRFTQESAGRTELVKAQLGRQRFRTEVSSEEAYIASLHIKHQIERPTEDAKLARIADLFERTTQFNATGRKVSALELKKLAGDPAARVFSINVADRFGDHGLVGAAVVEHGEITGLVLSCRVLGMGIEHKFVQHVIAESEGPLMARINETARNIPVRNIYRDNGFVVDKDGVWRLASGSDYALRTIPA